MIKILTYIVMAVSMVGTIANSCKKHWCFYIWLCTNAFWCVYNFSIGQIAQGLLYTFHFSMAILGIYQWKNNKNDFENKTLYTKGESEIDNEWQKRYFQLDKEWQDKYDDEVRNYECEIQRLEKKVNMLSESLPTLDDKFIQED